MTSCFSIILLFFCLIFNNSPSSKSQLIIAFVFWLPFLGTFHPRFMTNIQTTALISLCTIIIWSTLLLYILRAFIYLNFTHDTLIMIIQHFLCATVSHWNSCIIVIWSEWLLFIAWLCIVFAHHSLQWCIFIRQRDTSVLNWRLLLNRDFIFKCIHVCSLISSGYISVSLISFNDRAKVSKSILPCYVITLSAKDRIEQIRLWLQPVSMKSTIFLLFRVNYCSWI